MSIAKSEGGFTLIELLTALLILSLLALMSYRGLNVVLEARAHVGQETAKWRRVAAFCARFEQDAQLATPRPVRGQGGDVPAWLGRPESVTTASSPPVVPRLEFSRAGADELQGAPHRVAYGLNAKQEIELWLWPGLDVSPTALPTRHPVLSGVTKLEIQYLSANLAWVDFWPSSPQDSAIPRAVRLRIVLAPNEEVVRVFALNS